MTKNSSISAATRTARQKLANRTASAVAVVIAIAWTIPTVGLFVSSIRHQDDIKKTGWWTVFSNPSLTLENYQNVLFGSGSSGQLADYFVNSVVIALPSVLIPLALGLMAAYAFCFLEWKGKDVVFLIIFGLQIVPIQMALIPLLTIAVSVDLNSISPFLPIWITHTIFAMPLAVFLLHNFMFEIPQELIQAARVDGASEVSILLRVVFPLMLPGIASYATLQFLWVWNDLLIALTFVGGNVDAAPLTVRLANLAGTNGVGWHLLTSGAFVSMVIPLTVFFLLERYIVRGSMAGSMKG
ncbi:MAG: carbohydrate ABC transporter permease [Schaalia turicensis]